LLGNVNTSTTVLLADDVSATEPIWSQDGQSLTYTKLKSMQGTFYQYEILTTDCRTMQTNVIAERDAMGIILLAWSRMVRLYTSRSCGWGEADIWALTPEAGDAHLFFEGGPGCTAG